ncbi:MAG: TolC family protein [Rhodospirillales bacterium]|nr:TolC family protein [Rhodospirillales bacterium]
MTKAFHIGGRAARLAASVSALALLAACAVTPEPFTQAEFEAKASADRTAMFEGQEPLAAPLTLEEAMSRVLKYNLDKRAKMMEQALALGQTNLDRFDLLPQMAANAGYKNKSHPYATISRSLGSNANTGSDHTYSAERDTITADLGLTWNVLDFGVSYFTAHQNADKALIAQERHRRTLQNLSQEVRTAFWRAAAAQVLRGKVRSTVAGAEAALRDAERVEAERLRNPNDSLRIQKTLLENLHQLEAIDQELTSAKAELAALINVAPGTDFTLDTRGAMTVPVADVPVERMEELALANNPDLRVEDYQGRIATEETRKAILRLLPGITFSLSKQYDSNYFLAANTWNEAGAQIAWNLMNVVSAPDRINFAQTAEKVAETKRIALRMAVLAQVHVVSNQFMGSAKQFQRADQLWSIESRLAETSASQSEGGAGSAIDKITQNTSAIAAELRRYQAYAQLQSAFGKLQATIGMDPASGAVSSRLSDNIPAQPVAKETQAQPVVDKAEAAPSLETAATAQANIDPIVDFFSKLFAPPAKTDEKPVSENVAETLAS